MEKIYNLYRNKEYVVDYLPDDKKIRRLYDIDGIPDKVFGHMRNPLLSHMRMMYRHVDWDGFVVKLDAATIRLLKDKFEGDSSMMEYLDGLKRGDNVVIVDGNEFAPVTYSEMVSNSVGIEILTIDEALDRAATWFALNYTDSCYGFRMTTINFLIAFRLALMEGDMTPDERFSKERYNKVWREMYVSLLYHAGNKMIQESCKFVDRDYFAPFDLQEKEIKIDLQDGC